MRKHYFIILPLWFVAFLIGVCFIGTSTTCLAEVEKKDALKVSNKESDSGKAKETYLLRYRFRQGETILWDVFHHSRIQTTVSGTTQTSETITNSTKVWKVVKVNDDGSGVFENQTQDVDMWQKMTGCEEVRYNSKKDKKPPHGFENVAGRIGKPIARITLDPLGGVKKRVELVDKHDEDLQKPLAIPLPKEAVPVGHVWRIPHDVYVALENGLTKKVLVHQVFTFKSVKNHVATIDIATQILTPIDDPAIEIKLINQFSQNTVQFDIKLGQMISQEQTLDKKVLGFRGPDSHTHYLTRFTEKLQTLK